MTTLHPTQVLSYAQDWSARGLDLTGAVPRNQSPAIPLLVTASHVHKHPYPCRNVSTADDLHGIVFFVTISLNIFSGGRVIGSPMVVILLS